ncbi:MAG: precorrin-2 C(20)-methyltransferase [Candidatus Schekmanbacteria bacterium]|nr:precorrin-2 C(20)-methyltransferase [Candidatus Schekmanbacteria bacterium]
MPKLYGIGIGPGDPELLTVKAQNILKRMDLIFAPQSYIDKDSRAESIIRGVISQDTEIRRLLFPMSRDKQVLNQFWRQAADQIAEALKIKAEAAFITLGDPLTYSTYIYLLYMLKEHYPHIQLETVPGITSYAATAAAANLPMVEGGECLAIFPVARNSHQRLKNVLQHFETTVLMKIGNNLTQVLEVLQELKLLDHALMVSQAGFTQQIMEVDLSRIKEESRGYLAVIIVKNPHKSES